MPHSYFILWRHTKRKTNDDCVFFIVLVVKLVEKRKGGVVKHCPFALSLISSQGIALPYQ